MPLLEIHRGRDSLCQVRIYEGTRIRRSYIGECRQLLEADVLLSTNDGISLTVEKILILGLRALARVDEDPRFAEVGLVAAMEVLVGTAKLVEVVRRFGSFRIRVLDKMFSNLVHIQFRLHT